MTTAQETKHGAPEPDQPLAVGSTLGLGPATKAPRWWHCDTHGPGNANAWGCPECVREMRDEISQLRGQHTDSLLAVIAAQDAELTQLRAELAAEREWCTAKMAQAEYLIGAFERGADAADYSRDIAEFRA